MAMVVCVFYGGGVLVKPGALDIGWGHLIHRRRMEDWKRVKKEGETREEEKKDTR